MFAVGHLAFGYLLAKATAKILRIGEIDLPTVFMLSVIPDVDLVIPMLPHRGPTHSLILLALFFVPFYFREGKIIVPYFVALFQHSAVGDFSTSMGVMCLWPFSSEFYGLGVDMMGTVDLLAEGLSFLAAFALMVSAGDVRRIFKIKETFLFLVPPLGALFPVLLGKLPVPAGLIVPHCVLFTFFVGGFIAGVHNVVVGFFSRRN